MSHSLAYYVYTTATEDEEEEHDMMMSYNTSIVSQLNRFNNYDVSMNVRLVYSHYISTMTL